MDCIEQEDCESLQLLMNLGVSPNVNDSENFAESWLPIFHAIDIANQSRINGYEYSLNIIKQLVEAGCDLSVTYRGQTPADLALEFGFVDAYDFIVQHRRL
jgi:hypothetical protein